MLFFEVFASNIQSVKLAPHQTCRKCTGALRLGSSSSRSWQRGFAEEKKTGREGTTGEELSGDPNRVPKKGEQDKEGEGAMKVRIALQDLFMA